MPDGQRFDIKEWFITDDDGLCTTIRDREDPPEEEGDDFGAVCWGATPADAQRIVTSHTLTKHILELADLGQIVVEGVAVDLIKLDELVEDARAAQGEPPAPVTINPIQAIKEHIVALEKVVGDLLGIGEGDSSECFWCLEPMEGRECENPECRSVIATALITHDEPEPNPTS